MRQGRSRSSGMRRNAQTSASVPMKCPVPMNR